MDSRLCVALRSPLLIIGHHLMESVRMHSRTEIEGGAQPCPPSTAHTRYIEACRRVYASARQRLEVVSGDASRSGRLQPMEPLRSGIALVPRSCRRLIAVDNPISRTPSLPWIRSGGC